jgi:hypothetical protein
MYFRRTRLKAKRSRGLSHLLQIGTDSPPSNNKQRMSDEFSFATPSKARPSNQAATGQKWVRRTSKRKFPSEEKKHNHEVKRKSVTLEPKLCISTEGNVKRKYQRRNSVILPPLGPPPSNPTIEDIQRIVLANAKAMEAREIYAELQHAEAERCIHKVRYEAMAKSFRVRRPCDSVRKLVTPHGAVSAMADAELPQHKPKEESERPAGKVHVQSISLESDDGSLEGANKSKLSPTSGKTGCAISAYTCTERMITDACQPNRSVDIPPLLLEPVVEHGLSEVELPTSLHAVHLERSFYNFKNLVLSSALGKIRSPVNGGENQIIVDMVDNGTEKHFTCTNENESLASSVATPSKAFVIKVETLDVNKFEGKITSMTMHRYEKPRF